MKKLLKSEVCGTQEQSTGALFTVEKSKHATRKKKERNATVDLQMQIQTDTKDIYDKVITRKRAKKDITSKFFILVGSHRG